MDYHDIGGALRKARKILLGVSSKGQDMEPSESEKIIWEVAQYEDWNVLSMERRAALGLRTEARPEGQLKWLLEEGENGTEAEAIST